MRVVITGAGGQLGVALAEVYAEHEVVALQHADLDIADQAAVFDAITRLEPDLVLHAAAWTDVDGCEQDPDRAHRVNALGAWWVACACDRVGASMVHVSTDYVFGGRGARRPYSEFDPVRPINSYGRTKAASEELVRGALRRHYIVRTSWLCGASGSNFVNTMLKIGREGGRAAVVDDQVGSPTFATSLAQAIRELERTGRYGSYHRTNTGSCSWYEFAAAIFELAGMEVELERMSSDELGRDAARPGWSVLSNQHAEISGLTALPHWRNGLADFLGSLHMADRT